jgi:hypothetical protein
VQEKGRASCGLIAGNLFAEAVGRARYQNI